MGFKEIIDNLNRTSYGGTNVVGNLVKSLKGTEVFNPVEAFKRGVTLEETPLGSEVLEEIIGSPSENASVDERVARGAAGLLVDVFADPLTYIGIGGLTKIGKAAKIAGGVKETGQAIKEGSAVGRILKDLKAGQETIGKTLKEQASLGQRGLLTLGGRSLLGSKIDEATFGFIEQAKNYMKTMPVIGDAINGAKELFSVKSGIKEVDDAVDRFLGSMNVMSKNPYAKGQEIAKMLKGMKKEEIEMIQKAIVRPEEIILTGRNAQVAEVFKKYMAEVADVEMSKKILTKTIDNYMPTIATENFYDFMHKIGTRAGMRKSELDTALQHAMPKEITKGVTASEMNKAIKLVIGNSLDVKEIRNEILERLSPESMGWLDGIQKQAAQFGIKKVGDFFHDDLAVLAAARGVKSAKAVATNEFVDAMKVMGIPEESFKKLGKEKVFGFRKPNVPQLGDHYFQNDVARAMERWNKLATDDKYIKSFGSMYKGLINLWKRWTLTIFPEYHARNVMGNAWNNWISIGLNDVREYIQAGAIQKHADGVMIKISPTGQQISGRQVMNEMEQFNLLDTGMTATETAESVMNKLKGSTINPMAENNALIRGGRKVGNIVENNGKIAHYIFLRKQGYAPTDIANSVKAALFDYQALTPFERNYMRYIFPFYTWSKNNIPLQIKNIVMQPEKFARIGKAKAEIEEQQGTAGTDITWMPEWMKDSLPIILDKMPEPDRFQVMLLLSWLPAGDIQKIFDPVALASSSLEPFSKEVLQQISGRDFFLNKDIQDYPGEVESMLGIDMDSRAKHVLKMFRLVNFLDQMNPGGIFGTKGEAKSIFGFERRMIDMSGSQRAAKMVTGLKLYPFDVAQSKKYSMAKLNKDIKGAEVMKKKFMKQGDEVNVEKISELIQRLKEKKMR